MSTFSAFGDRLERKSLGSLPTGQLDVHEYVITVTGTSARRSIVRHSARTTSERPTVTLSRCMCIHSVALSSRQRRAGRTPDCRSSKSCSSNLCR